MAKDEGCVSILAKLILMVATILAAFWWFTHSVPLLSPDGRYLCWYLSKTMPWDSVAGSQMACVPVELKERWQVFPVRPK
jgi:hypothetical protein